MGLALYGDKKCPGLYVYKLNITMKMHDMMGIMISTNIIIGVTGGIADLIYVHGKLLKG